MICALETVKLKENFCFKVFENPVLTVWLSLSLALVALIALSFRSFTHIVIRRPLRSLNWEGIYRNHGRGDGANVIKCVLYKAQAGYVDLRCRARVILGTTS